MSGHVRQRGQGRWELRIYQGTDPATGGQKWATRTVPAASKRAAQRLLPAFQAEAEADRLRAGDATFAEVLDAWIDLKGDLWSPATLVEHRRIAATRLAPLRPRLVHELRTVDFDELYKQLRRTLSPGSVRRTHVVARAALQQAMRWELILRNPAALAEPGDPDEGEVVPPSIAELGRLLDAAERGIVRGQRARPTPEVAVFLVVAAVTGARRGAICALRWTDLDLERGVIRFPRVITVGDDGPVERTASRSKRSAKIAALDPVTTAALAQHRLTMEARAIELGVEVAPDAFVFSDDPAGRQPWRPDSTSRKFRRARELAGLPDTVRLHDLRHFMATLALAGGIDPKTVATRGGWRQAATMLDRYAHVLEPVDRRAADLLGEAVHRPDLRAVEP